jgi:hypothetical protein
MGSEENWNRRLEELFPFRFNTIEVVDGTVRFLAPGISTKDAITARNVDGEITNLTNVIESGKEASPIFARPRACSTAHRRKWRAASTPSRPRRPSTSTWRSRR